MTHQQILDTVINCWEYSPGLGKNSFSPAKLCALPRGFKIGAYTDTSILFTYNGREYYGSYDWKLSGWVFE